MKLVTLTGPTCSGKTTLLNKLVADHGFKALVSHTTRPMRQGEVQDVDYHFVSNESFDNMLAAGLFLEHVEFSNNRYGVSLKEVADANKAGGIPAIIVEPNGLAQIAKYCYENNIKRYSWYIGGDAQTLISRYLARELPLGKTIDQKTFDKFAGETSRRILGIQKEIRDWPQLTAYNVHGIMYKLDDETENTYINGIKEVVYGS